MAEDREQWARRLDEIRRPKSCCSTHRLALLRESVGLPLLALADLNFLQCFDCRSAQRETLIPPAESLNVPPSGAISSSSSLHDFFCEYSAAVCARVLRKSGAFCRAKQGSRHRPSCRENVKQAVIEENEEGGDDNLGNFDDVYVNERQLPLHLILSDCVLSHLPLADVIRARRVSRVWMSTIDNALRNSSTQVHPYAHRPCLMLLHPGSEKIGTSAALSVFNFSSNAWLTKPIIFPSKASYLVGTSLGLFCLATDNPFRTHVYDPLKTGVCFRSKNVDFFVGNPLTEMWTCLPRPSRTRCKCNRKVELAAFAFVAYVNPTNASNVGFKLIKVQFAKESRASNKVYIYDSCLGRWNKESFEGWSIQNFVFEIPGLLHCFSRYGSLICTYNLATHTSKAYLGEPAQEIRNGWHCGVPSLVQCAERSFCVREATHRELKYAFVGLIPCTFHKWPVQVCRLGDDTSWELMSEMPLNLLKEAVEHGSDGTDFVIGSDHMRRIFFILKGSSKMLVFDVLLSEWDTLPGCTFVPSFYPHKLHAFCEPLI
ncbi:hypothetical protein L7F22_000886 [Adiantum nelumboides]|nr:hypothetical protein [Adiantum nelumboides]